MFHSNGTKKRDLYHKILFRQVFFTKLNIFVTLVNIERNKAKERHMYTTQLDNGTLNNYALEPKMSYAEYPTVWEQKRYLQQGAVAAFLVTALVLISSVVS